MILSGIDEADLYNYEWRVDILNDRDKKISVPVVEVKQKKFKTNTTLIYSHGNSSDLSSGLSYLLEFMKIRNVNIIVYDYTGYGASEIS